MKVHILNRAVTLPAEPGENLLKLLQRHGLVNDAPCGGNGTCGKCKVKIVQGSVGNVTPDENGYVLSCKAVVEGNLTVFLPEQIGGGVTEFTEIKKKGERVGLGIALDIGTTTLGACLVQLQTGETLKRCPHLIRKGFAVRMC